ncbi:MAG: hypothetical protein AUI15_00185 [Actinobacteria bacterium 13_2_20CM_2_66_6]|nr:MAG: hypothetical protein AUI15_00185 [Actinobacteria bacterium 13_2_20CM_2_66_6]
MRTVSLRSTFPRAPKRLMPAARKSVIVPFTILTFACFSFSIPLLLFVPSIVWPLRSTVMLSAPMIRPVPGQLVRSFVSVVLLVNVWPHETLVRMIDA